MPGGPFSFFNEIIKKYIYLLVSFLYETMFIKSFCYCFLSALGYYCEKPRPSLVYWGLFYNTANILWKNNISLLLKLLSSEVKLSLRATCVNQREKYCQNYYIFRPYRKVFQFFLEIKYCILCIQVMSKYLTLI